VCTITHAKAHIKHTSIEEASLILAASSFLRATLAEEDVQLLEGTYGKGSPEIESVERDRVERDRVERRPVERDGGERDGGERRRFRRVPVLRRVKYFSDKFGETGSLILDLSCGGAFIESPVVPEATHIELEFNLIDGYTVRASAVVRYVILGAGMGVEFQALSEEDVAQIRNFVEGFRAHAVARVADDLK
jgi:hypothetical protein